MRKWFLFLMATYLVCPNDKEKERKSISLTVTKPFLSFVKLCTIFNAFKCPLKIDRKKRKLSMNFHIEPGKRKEFNLNRPRNIVWQTNKMHALLRLRLLLWLVAKQTAWKQLLHAFEHFIQWPQPLFRYLFILINVALCTFY